MPQTSTQDGNTRTVTVPARLLMMPIAGYRRFISPLLGPRCRFAPSCSEYALEALRVHGAVRGLWLAVRRLAVIDPGSGGHQPMRSADGRAPAAGPRFGVRLGGVGPGGRDRLHYPDMVIVTDTG